MMLDKKFRKQCVEVRYLRVSYKAVEDLINRHYKNSGFSENFDLPTTEERGNNEDWVIYICSDPLDVYGIEEIKPTAEGKYKSRSAQYFLQDLCHNGIIPVGGYCIDVSW